MEIRVKLEDIKKMGFSFAQYVFMWSIYNQIRLKHFMVDEEALEELIKDGYLVKNTTGYNITVKAENIFEPSTGSFSEFISTFPTRVHDHNGVVRVLSPADPSTLVGDKLRKKWYSITKNKIELSEKILKCLKCEVELRKRENSLYWMRNAETWLNKATWEDYEYLLEQPIKETGTKINEIRL